MQINSHELPAVAATALRYALTTVGGILVTKGFLPADSDVNSIVGAVLIIVATGYGMYKTRANKKELVQAATTPPSQITIK